MNLRNTRDNLLDQRGATFNREAWEKSWSSLWNTKVPGKIITFLWRLAKHYSLSEDMRHHKNMCNADFCQLCGAADSWRHSLIDCTTSRCVCALGDEKLTDQIVESHEPNAKNWLFNMMDSLSHAEFVKMVVTLWALWTARRKAIHESIFQSPISTHRFVESFIPEMDGLNISRTSTSAGHALVIPMRSC